MRRTFKIMLIAGVTAAIGGVIYMAEANYGIKTTPSAPEARRSTVGRLLKP